MAVSRQWINALPAPSGELKNVQLFGRESFSKLGIPNTDIEEWRITDMKKIENILGLSLISANTNPYKDSNFDSIKIPKDSLRINLNYNNLKKITIPTNLRQLNSSEIDEILNNQVNYNAKQEDFIVNLNYAANNNLIALKIKDGSKAKLELIAESIQNTFCFTRVILVVGKNSELDLMQVLLGSKNSAQNNLIEIYLQENAKVNHGFIANGSLDSALLSRIEISQDIKSEYCLTAVQHGWEFSRLEPHIVQNNGQANSVLKGLQVSKNKNQMATCSKVNFQGPDGTLDQLQKTIASGKSHSIFNGAILVPQSAQKTNAAQLSRNLLLSEKARIDTKPELEIIADDVRCAHGATVSNLQEEELFYLRSRGINSNQATALLLKGYCQEIIDHLPLEGDRWNILNNILNSVQ